jgi:NAD(P)-dependent dehydrogenase (short-subunit alcohol dehydrogenase family)
VRHQALTTSTLPMPLDPSRDESCPRRLGGGDPGALATMIPVGRLGRPEEVADLALAVLRNGYMTNQVVSLDGGMHPR